MAEAYSSPFFTIPSRILDIPNITLQLLRFYETIFQFWHHGKNCYLSNEMIKERTGISSTSSISKAFQFFEEAKEMYRVYLDGKRFIVQPSHSIALPDDSPEKVSNDPKASDPLSLQRDPPSRCSETPPLATARHNKNNLNNKKNNKNSCPSDDLWTDFKQIYPRRKDTHKAKKIFLKLTPEEQREVLVALRLQVELDPQYKGDTKFIPMASTYLNGRRWEDEVEKPSTTVRAAAPKPHEPRSTVREWAPGNPDYDRVNQGKRQAQGVSDEDMRSSSRDNTGCGSLHENKTDPIPKPTLVRSPEPRRGRFDDPKTAGAFLFPRDGTS